MDMEAWRAAWGLFIMAPVPFGAAIILIAAGAWAAAWFLRAQIDKERLATKEEQVNLARAQRKDLAAKLKNAESEFAKLRQQISSQANQTALTDAAASTASLFSDAGLVLDRLGVTLTQGDTRMVVRWPKEN